MHVVHEKRSHLPTGWSLSRRHTPYALFPLRFGLRQSNLEHLDKFLMDVAHPDSPNYGKHWMPDEVAKMFAPSRDSLDMVLGWLKTEGFGSERTWIASTGSWIHVNTSVEDAERLLHTQYNVYAHVSGGEHIATESYQLPQNVSLHVDFVTPSIHFDSVLPKRHGSTKKMGLPGVGIMPKTTGQIGRISDRLKHCDTQIVPSCLRALYGLVYQPVAASRNSFAVVEYTPQAYLQSDLDKFHKNFSKELVGKSPKLVAIDGGIVQTIQTEFDYNGESNLDLQYAMNLVNMECSRQEVTLYQVGDIPQGASFNNFLDALDGAYCQYKGGDDPNQDGVYPDSDYFPNGYNTSDCGIIKPANVISTSYGYNEADLSPFYAARQCAEYGKLGLMGVTILYSSGDNGVAGNEGLCLNPDGSQSYDGLIFNPSFPSTYPYVTAVGATQINPGSNVTDPEAACEQVISSGGGFSNYFAMPEYQKKAIGSYLKNHRPELSGALWNSTGISRAYPDISANGANYVVAVDGSFSRLFGTSASAPVVGAILTMVNDARLAIGKKPVGFINPTIYSDLFVGAFNDIKQGGNDGCGSAGFNAVAGWDPVTGLGTPKFPQLVARWLLLP
ncbi:subtilisin-like protein [Pholiota conissans]|uniref:tripeptidyl-peptidase II n=1 Tax=Pholiota conissans TaxID=109636 RepID=A0A9P6CP87_9AGAR|nr:subtilisin-like protein [Pholiota conissans]